MINLTKMIIHQISKKSYNYLFLKQVIVGVDYLYPEAYETM